MDDPKNQFICIKELVADDGVHFKKGNCYIGETKIFDESLTLLGEQGIHVSFYGGNDYLKRLVYKGTIKTKEDGSLTSVKLSHTILGYRPNGDYNILGTVWNVDGKENVKLDSRTEVDSDYTLEIRDAESNNVIYDKDLIGKINKKIKRNLSGKEKVAEENEED